MLKTVINGKPCNSINDFYNIRVPKIKYSHTTKPIPLVCDFYNDFLIDGKRLPEKHVVEEWHKLLVWYIEQPDATFFVRKYEGGKDNSEWNNRRGALIQYDDGTEIVYSSNFLAHEIFLMAYHGFVPDKDDFKSMVKERKLHITSGTKVEKLIRTYPSGNKVLTYCYLAHIMDVNGQYLRDDGSYRKLSKAEEENIFPRGATTNWTSSPDNIWHMPRSLSLEERELVKAHCLRFLDPMNYYLTPLTNQCTHSIPSFKKNIGEFSYLTYYVQQQYSKIYGSLYTDLVQRGRFSEQKPKGYTGRERIDLEYSSENTDLESPATAPAEETSSESTATSAEKSPASATPPTTPVPVSSNPNEDFLDELGDFMRDNSKLSEGTVRTYLDKIKHLLDRGYTVDNLCDGIDEILQAHRVGGQCYDENDSGNTSAALGQILKMIRHPYICYNLGYFSFRPKGEYMTGYCIDGDTITISYNRGFTPLKDTIKKIPARDLKKLRYLLQEAAYYNVFAKSNTNIRTTHGYLCNIDYSYGHYSGVNCSSLFDERSAVAVHLGEEFSKLILKLTL